MLKLKKLVKVNIQFNINNVQVNTKFQERNLCLKIYKGVLTIHYVIFLKPLYDCSRGNFAVY